MSEPKKTKAQINKEFRTKLFEQFLIAHGLIIDSTYSFSYLKIRLPRPISEAYPRLETSYSSHLEDFEDKTFSKFHVDNSVAPNLFIKDKELLKSDYIILNNEVRLVFISKLLDIYQQNISEEDFIKLLDKKDSKDKYDPEKDMKIILYYLISSQPQSLFKYINRHKFLLLYFNLLPGIFDTNIITSFQKTEIFNNLMKIDKLQNVSNQNIIYKILNTYIENPEQYYNKFKTISQEKNVEFLDIKDSTIKIEIDYIVVNSLNIQSREYTNKQEVIILLEKTLEKLNEFKEQLNYENYSFDKRDENFAIYFTGKNIKTDSIKRALNLIIQKTFKENKWSDAWNIKISNAEILHCYLMEDLEETKEGKIKRKI